MDQEKLVESVKSWEALYVMSHSRYSDMAFKENAWRAIAKEMRQSVATCKKTWTGLRDSYRRALKKKRETKSGQPALKQKKWKFEDEMSFLLPYMQERNPSTSLTEMSDEDNEDEQKTEECIDNNDDKENDRNDNRRDDKDDDNNDDADNNESNAENDKIKRESNINENIITKVRKNKGKKSYGQPETASVGVVQYLLAKQTSNPTIIPPTNQRPSAIESFFSSIATMVENFSPYYQNIAKSKIFAIVTDLEMQQIMQQQQFLMPNVPTQRPCSAPMTTPSPSPSISGTPPLSYHGLPETNQMAHEEVFYNERTKM